MCLSLLCLTWNAYVFQYIDKNVILNNECNYKKKKKAKTWKGILSTPGFILIVHQHGAWVLPILKRQKHLSGFPWISELWTISIFLQKKVRKDSDVICGDGTDFSNVKQLLRGKYKLISRKAKAPYLQSYLFNTFSWLGLHSVIILAAMLSCS